MRPDDDRLDGMVKTGTNEKAEARVAADELRRRLNDNTKTASPAARQMLREQLAEAERKL